MRIELLPLMKYEISSKSFLLDDYSSGSYAVYSANNEHEKLFVYCMPDEVRGPDPRCDYLLVCDEDCTVRFIELKGVDLDSNSCNAGCKTAWEHAFHQLFETYIAYKELISEEDDVRIVFCTSVHRKRISNKYSKRKFYKQLLKAGIIPRILCCDDEDDEV